MRALIISESLDVAPLIGITNLSVIDSYKLHESIITTCHFFSGTNSCIVVNMVKSFEIGPFAGWLK